MNISPEPAPLAHDPHWRRARASFARAVAAIGSPVAIAAIACLTGALRRQIVRWLCPLEHIARKLLLAEAAKLRVCSPVYGGAVTRSVTEGTPRIAPSLARCARATSPVNGGGKTDLSRPETWNARFSFSLPRDRFAVPESRAPRIRALWGPTPAASPCHSGASRSDASGTRVINPEDSAFRLARRFEALRRVLENPAPHARRLLRLIIRTLPRFPEAARNFAVSPACAVGFDPADPRLSIEAVGLALDAGFDFDTS